MQRVYPLVRLIKKTAVLVFNKYEEKKNHVFLLTRKHSLSIFPLPSGCVLTFDEVTSRNFASLQSSCQSSCDMHMVLQQATERFQLQRRHLLLAGDASQEPPASQSRTIFMLFDPLDKMSAYCMLMLTCSGPVFVVTSPCMLLYLISPEKKHLNSPNKCFIKHTINLSQRQ